MKKPEKFKFSPDHTLFSSTVAKSEEKKKVQKRVAKHRVIKKRKVDKKIKQEHKEIKKRMTSELKAKEKEINTLKKALDKKQGVAVPRQARRKATVPKFGKVEEQVEVQPQMVPQVPQKKCSKVGQVCEEVEGYGGS